MEIVTNPDGFAFTHSMVRAFGSERARGQGQLWGEVGRLQERSLRLWAAEPRFPGGWSRGSWRRVSLRQAGDSGTAAAALAH